jgi:RNA polymerase sigma factor (sigma-70 family)
MVTARRSTVGVSTDRFRFGSSRAMSEENFESFFARMLPRAVRVGRRVTGDPWLAEDVAVEALAKAHARWARVAPLPWRDAWLLKVTAREALRQVRRHLVLAAPPDRGDESDEVVLRAALVAALAKLPRRQQEAISLRYLCDLSESDVAIALGVSAGTVKTHLHRGLAALRGSLGAEPEEELAHEM